ncbi:MAG: S8 family serine peptidase [Thermoleophilia bacterium]|nr:S8 family serine peptidase [Thermoleophilia bacterium]
MRTRRLPDLALVVASLAAVVIAGGASARVDERAAGAAGWQGLLGSRPVPQLGDRWVVVLRGPSLAARVRRAPAGAATEAQMKTWTRAAREAQEAALARLAFRGAPIQPEHVFVRLFNGFAASLDARTLAVLGRSKDVAGVYPVRAAYPAAEARSVLATDAFAPGSGRRPDVGVPGLDGAGVTIALLDTGIDVDHPYIRRSLLRGIDVLDPNGLAMAAQNPTQPGRLERHGTELAGLIVGDGGPAGLHGVAPQASVRPIRVAGWQPDASGDVAVYARTDQLLAGLEAAVDPNQDGDAHDAARIALVGVVEPFSSFADGPLARATRGALSLGMLVIAPSGNDGPAGPSYGSVGGPGGTAGALAVAAADSRRTSPVVHVLLRSGLRVLVSGKQPLGGAVPPGEPVTAPVAALPERQAAVVGGESGLERQFDARGYSAVAGSAALLPPGPPTPEAVRELATAGARAVLVDGPLPAGSLGVDEAFEVPILGLPVGMGETVRQLLASGRPVELALGATAIEGNPDLAAVAPFSSEGLAFDGSPKPEVAAPGVGLATSEPGRGDEGAARYGTVSGSSAAAAIAAGAAALVVQARPDLDASGLRGVLVASARPIPGGSGVAAGTIDPAAATAIELVAEPPIATLGGRLAEGGEATGSVTVHNVSRRPLAIRVGAGATPSGVTLTAKPAARTLRPGATVEIRLIAAVEARPGAPGALEGVLRVTARAGGVLRVPWAIAVPASDRALLDGVRLSTAAFKPSDTQPAVLSLVAGRVDGSIDRPQLLPLKSLTIDLYRGRRNLGRLVGLRDVLPGRYAFGITGRGPRGARLAPAGYELAIVATPVGGGRPEESRVVFRVR